MTVLQLEQVSKRYRRGSLEVPAVREVSLELHAGELVSIWGMPGSGRSTLLRLAAGIEPPDHGTVRFQGRDLAGGIPRGLAYCQRKLRGGEGQTVLDGLIAAQLVHGRRLSEARTIAVEALERVDSHCSAELGAHELEPAEAVRVSIARALVQRPAALVIDEPTIGMDLRKRDPILGLLRSLADEGIAVLISVDRGTALFAAHRALSLSEGRLHGNSSPELAPVVPLPMRVSG